MIISVSTKMPYQEVMENFLRSGISQGKVRENKSGEKWLPSFLAGNPPHINLNSLSTTDSFGNEKAS